MLISLEITTAVAINKTERQNYSLPEGKCLENYLLWINFEILYIIYCVELLNKICFSNSTYALENPWWNLVNCKHNVLACFLLAITSWHIAQVSR